MRASTQEFEMATVAEFKFLMVSGIAAFYLKYFLFSYTNVHVIFNK
jgi:hypothetical protein